MPPRRIYATEVALSQPLNQIQVAGCLDLVNTHGMSAIVDGFVNVDIAIADFEIEAGTNPGFVLYGCALTAEV